MNSRPTSSVVSSVSVLVLATLFGSATVAVQDTTHRQQLPRKGDTIIVKGCLAGSMLLSTETQDKEGVALPVAAYAYQLKGKKALLKELREKHEGVLVALTGELKSTLTDNSSLGTRIGNTTIAVGGDPRTREQAMHGTGQTQPVLEVKSYEGTTISCRR